MLGNRFTRGELPKVLFKLCRINPEGLIQLMLRNIRFPTTKLFLAVLNELGKLLLWGQDFSGTPSKARAILRLPWGQSFGTLPQFPLIPLYLGLG